MTKTIKAKPPYTHSELEAELVRLKSLLGRLQTNTQIKAACLERESIDFGLAKNILKNNAFWEYIRRLSPRTQPGHHKVWDEVTLYDRMGAISQDLVDGQDLDEKAFVEQGRAVDIWKRLDGYRGLSLLVDGAELSAAKSELEAGRISGAEFFRIFLKLEKIKYGVKQWDVSTLYDRRCRLHKCVMQMEELRTQKNLFVVAPLPITFDITPRDALPPTSTPITESNLKLNDSLTTKNPSVRKRRSSSDLADLAEDLRGRAAKRVAENMRFQSTQSSMSTTITTPLLEKRTTPAPLDIVDTTESNIVSSEAASQEKVDNLNSRTSLGSSAMADSPPTAIQNVFLHFYQHFHSQSNSSKIQRRSIRYSHEKF